MKFSIKDFFSKRDQTRSFLQIWSHLLKKSLMENFILCAVIVLLKRVFFFSVTRVLAYYIIHKSFISTYGDYLSVQILEQCQKFTPPRTRSTFLYPTWPSCSFAHLFLCHYILNKLPILLYLLMPLVDNKSHQHKF